MTESDPQPPVPSAAQTDASVIGMLAHFAARDPQRPAYLDAHGTLSYGALHQAVRRGAAWLAGQGVKAGDTVALAFEPDGQAVRRDIALFYAAGHLGAALLPVNPEVPPLIAQALLVRYRANWLIAAGAPPRVGSTQVLDPRRFDAGDAALDGAPAPRGDAPEAGFVYLFTSGTTGEAKALLLTHRQIMLRYRAVARQAGMDASDRALAGIPWPAIPTMRMLTRVLVIGATCVSAPLGGTRAAFGAVLARFGVTRVFASPWQIRQLLESPAPLLPLPPLRALHVLGAPISHAELDAARAALGPNVVLDYSTNETGSITLLRPGDAVPAPDCVGTLVEGMEARVAGPDGALLAPGETGELGFRAAWMCTRYAGNPQATAERFRDGFVYLGDAGSVDAQGLVYLRGRTREVINYGGMKIWPEDIEAVLRQHPDLLDAALVGLPDAQAGQVPAAFVVPRPAAPGARSAQLDEAGLRAFCATRIESVRMPRHFFLASQIPRNAAGKILREALIEAHLGAQQPGAA